MTKKWRILFDPDEVVKDIYTDNLDDHQLKQEELKSVGVEITTWRRKIRDKALAADINIQNVGMEPPDVSTKLA